MSRAISMVFVVFIVFTLVATIFEKSTGWSENEKRLLAPWPSLPEHIDGLTAYFSAVDKYLNDHFYFRTYYIERYNKILDKIFHQTSPSSKVLKGLDGWYYLNDFNLLPDFLGLVPLKPTQLAAWIAKQEEKNRWLGEHGIRFLYMAAPDKQTVYPQFLMEHALERKGTTRLEQARNKFGGNLPGYMVDLYAELRPERYDMPLYFKNDSHWNSYGAYIAFLSIMRQISLWFPQQNFTTDFAFLPAVTGIGGNTGLGGDLAMMLMQRRMTETYPVAKRIRRCGVQQPIPYPLTNVAVGGDRDSFMRQCGNKTLRAVVFRDSFFVQVEPFLSENFGEIIYLWKEFDKKNIEELLPYFQPDIVIEEVVERHAFDSVSQENAPRKN